jgi:ADP-ribose pyrophosphatase YjhB (NUDIX family)
MGGDLGYNRKKAENEVKSLKKGIVLLLAIVGLLCLHIMRMNSSIGGSSSCALSFGAYHGNVYYSKESGTVSPPKCLLESKWMKIQQHTVKFPENDFVIDDWLWIDYHDRINVLVEAPDRLPDQTEKTFLIFDQTKYALEGRMSKAIIGGIIEPGEQPEHAARREVEEEMIGVQCTNFHFLGRYRTDVNRGMGWLNSFLATDCSRKTALAEHHLTKGEAAEEVGAADQERQDLRTITLSELREAARKGEFLEVQWSATVALALQHPELSNEN